MELPPYIAELAVQTPPALYGSETPAYSVGEMGRSKLSIWELLIEYEKMRLNTCYSPV
jgi:hypothetical protein